MKFPKEFNYGIWGGEGVIKGFQKRSPTKRRVPHFWVPILKKSVVFSAVLDKYFSIVVTDRTLDLIHQNLGFDHYILKVSTELTLTHTYCCVPCFFLYSKAITAPTLWSYDTFKLCYGNIIHQFCTNFLNFNVFAFK